MQARQDVEDRIGTCPSCWGEFKVRDDDLDGLWRVVLHGYQRPGDGRIVGRCPGTGEQPFEHSPDGLEKAIASLKIDVATAIEGSDARRVLQQRLQFAEQELAAWSRRPIPGIDIDPVPFRPRRPPTQEEIAERLRLGVRLGDDLKRAKREAKKALQRAKELEAKKALASRPPHLSVTFRVPNPKPEFLRTAEQKERELFPERHPSHSRPVPHEEMVRYRRWCEAKTEWSIADSIFRVDEDRLRLAVGRCASNWLAANGIQAKRPQSTIKRDLIETTIWFESVTWEVVNRVGELLEGVAKRDSAPNRVSWTLEAGDVHSLADALGIAPVEPSKMKTSRKPRQPATFPTWESLRYWDGENGVRIGAALNRFEARVDEVDWLWRIPDHLVPFLDPSVRSRPNIAIDCNGNAIYFCRLRREWIVEPSDDFGDFLGLSDADAETLWAAGVVGVSSDGRAFLPECVRPPYQRSVSHYAGFRIVPVGDLLGRDASQA